MPGAFVWCEVHHLQEDRQGIFVEGGVQFEVSGGTGECPICRRPSPFVRGDYGGTRDRPTAKLWLTPAQSRRLESVLQWARESAAEPDADIEKIAASTERELKRNSPRVYQLLEAFRSPTSANAAAWLAVLLALLMWLTTGNAVTQEDVERIVREAHEMPEQSPAAPAVPNTQEPPPRGIEDAPPATEIPTPRTR